MRMTRRQALKRGLAGVGVIAAGGLVWRAWDNGAFNPGGGPPYELWRDWREARLDGKLAIARAGILAANAHNTQPWSFLIGENAISLHADPVRNLGSFDPFRREMALSLGCAVENMVLAANALGDCTVVLPEPGHPTSGLNREIPVASLLLEAGAGKPDPLFEAIDRRHTNRGPYAGRAVSAEIKDALGALANHADTRLLLFDDDPQRNTLGRLIVSATETIIADPEMAADSARWFRFSRADIDRYRDGITLDATGLPGLVNVAAKLIPEPSPAVADRQWLDGTRDVHVATAPLLGMIAVRGLYDQANAIEAGRLWQRIHLWATVNGLAAHPLNQPVEIVDRARQLGKPPTAAGELATLTGDPAWLPTFVFRLGYAERPARPSPRRAVEDVVTGMKD